MKKILLFTLLLTSFISAQDMPRYIDVNGTSEISARADYINFVINIKNVAATLEESKQTNINASNSLVDIFDNFKISEEDFEISPIRFGKEYQYKKGERELLGYYSIVNVTVKLKQLNDYYAFISELSKNSLFEITRSDFGVSGILKYHKEATINAAKAAKEKAEYIAQSMGVKLGKVIQITELNPYQSRPTPLNTYKAAGSSQENISGNVSVSRSVNVKFEIID